MFVYSFRPHIVKWNKICKKKYLSCVLGMDGKIHPSGFNRNAQKDFLVECDNLSWKIIFCLCMKDTKRCKYKTLSEGFHRSECRTRRGPKSSAQYLLTMYINFILDFKRDLKTTSTTCLQFIGCLNFTKELINSDTLLFQDLVPLKNCQFVWHLFPIY